MLYRACGEKRGAGGYGPPEKEESRQTGFLVVGSLFAGWLVTRDQTIIVHRMRRGSRRFLAENNLLQSLPSRCCFVEESLLCRPNGMVMFSLVPRIYRCTAVEFVLCVLVKVVARVNIVHIQTYFLFFARAHRRNGGLLFVSLAFSAQLSCGVLTKG